MRRTYTGLILAALSGLSSASDFMGLELGVAFEGPRCKDFAYDDPAEYLKPGYGEQPIRPCWLPGEIGRKHVGDIPRDGIFLVAIHPERARLPEGVFRTLGVMIDGALEVVIAETSGQRVQADMLVALKAKFGRPVEESVVHHQNAFGATLEGLAAHWEASGLQVEFQGLSGTKDRGRITVSTRRGLARMAAEDENRRASSPKF